MIDRIARRYEGRWLQGYARGKLRSDPVFRAAFDLLKDETRPVLDIGCGIGLLEFYLRERGFTAPLTGFDFDEKKIAAAERIAAPHYSGIRFMVGEAAQTFPGEPGHVVLFDVLHYLDAAAQHTLLNRVADRVAPDALCLIRETPCDRSWRFRFTQLEELFLHAILWMKSHAVHFPAVRDISAPFVQRGFTAEVRPLWGRTPFNSHLFIFRAPPSAR